MEKRENALMKSKRVGESMAETKQKKERIVSLDLIRAVCPLMIVIYHFAAEAAALNLPYIQPLMNSVRFETTLFFMVSGASLMMS